MDELEYDLLSSFWGLSEICERLKVRTLKTWHPRTTVQKSIES